MIPKLKAYFKSISKLGKDLDVTLHSSNIIASEKLVEFSNIILGGFVTLGNSAPLVKKISEIKWGARIYP